MLFTVGYEGTNLEDFLATLSDAGVQHLVDIRQRAQSRKKGFSKTKLSEALKNKGIGYTHLRSLGDPKEGREAARRGDWGKFDLIYRGVLRSSEAVQAVGMIKVLLSSHKVCLLCYEKDYTTCHRKYVSDILERESNRSTIHLEVPAFDCAA